MRFFLDNDLEVLFPYSYIYPEQFEYMTRLKHALDKSGPAILEMPSGTGKTISLLSLIIAYQAARQPQRRLIYCSRTVPEVEKVVEEVRRLLAYRQRELGPKGAEYSCVALSSRKNLCIHPDVSARPLPGDTSTISAVEGLRSQEEVDSKCRDRTSSWARANEDMPKCDFFEDFEMNGKDAYMNGVYSLDDLRKTGMARNWCPYFLARHMINSADMVVFSYQYILNPKIAKLITGQFDENCIIVFDEAHNIDTVCIDALSTNLSRSTLDGVAKNLRDISAALEHTRREDAQRLKAEYNRLVEGLELPARITDQVTAPLIGAADVFATVRETVPGNMRRGEHFISCLHRILEFLKRKLKSQATIEWPKAFVFQMCQEAQVDPRSLRFCSARLSSLLFTIQAQNISQFSPISTFCDLATLLGTYEKGFCLLIEPDNLRNGIERDPTLFFNCLDASIAIQPVLQKFRSIIITSGTLSPIEMFTQILNFTPTVCARFKMSLHRRCVCPLFVSKGSDQVVITSKFESRKDPAVARNYGNLLTEMAEVVPDGIICFFPSYNYMEETINTWNSMGMLSGLLRNKLLFIETPNPTETTLALDNYRKACNCGRGAVLFSVARGKISEGIDFDHHYGRCVIVFGIPYIYTESRILKERLKYLRDAFKIREADFLTFDAMRTASQCMGRVIRGKSDYGIMVFADKRYSRHDKLKKLPQWIFDSDLDNDKLNLSVDTAVSMATEFLRTMGQPTNPNDELGKSLYTYEHVLQRLESMPTNN